MSSFFFDTGEPIRSKWTTRQAADDHILLGSNLRNVVFPDGAGRLTVVVCPVDSSGDPIESAGLLCKASFSEEVLGHHISVPSSWVNKYPATFSRHGPSEILIRQELPVALTSLIATALSNEAYSMGQTKLESLLHDGEPILREGDVLELQSTSSNSSVLKYRLELLEPVRQGISRPGTTRLLLISSNGTEFFNPPANPEAVEGVETPDLNLEDTIEIDEGFLANSLFGSDYAASLLKDQDMSSEMQVKNGPSFRQDFSPRSLNQPLSLSHDLFTLYVRTADLGRIGILSGDWAIVGTEASRSRLVRLEANDTVVSSSGTICGSPLLLYNTFAEQNETSLPKWPKLKIRPSPFGSLNPAIPTARTLTVARVASPLSINRQFQPLFIDALKTYFEGGRRLVKQGDLLGVTIDTDLSRLSPDKEHANNDVRTIMDNSRPNEVIFFKVTNIEYDVISRPDISTSNWSVLGEFGCWVDSAVTRIVQTGVENSRIPGVRSYLNLGLGANLTSAEESYLLSPNSPFSKIYSMTLAALTQTAVDYDLQLSFLLKGGRGVGKFTVASWVAEHLGLHLFELDCYDVLGDTDTKTEATLRVRLDQAKECTPCLFVLRNLEALSQTTQAAEPGKAEPVVVVTLREFFGEMQSNWRLTGYPVVFLGTTTDRSKVPPGLLSSLKHEIDFEAPQEDERLEILQTLLANQTVAADVSLESLATQTAALLAGDLGDLVSRAKSASIERAAQNNSPFSSRVPITAADFEKALSKARESYSESIGAPKIPAVSWDDVGGLAHVKSDILDTIQLPLEHPELFADGLKKRSGILLYGPPGTGKTLIAKAVATSFSLNFFSVKGPELLDMYIGESEANVRRVFQRARDAKPCVIFFDELDSVAPKRGNHGDSGGVMDRIVSQLLAELDGMSGGQGGADVFVIGATNRPDLLDPALLRPGRFDRLLYLGVSDTHEAQLNILTALTRKFRLDPNLDLRTIAEQCPFNYTGADFYALCSDAMLNAMSRKAEEIEEKIALLNEQTAHDGHPRPITPQYYLAELASPDEILVYVSENDFTRALNSLVPSVSPAEMEHYAAVQKRFSQDKGSQQEQVEVQLD